MKSLLIPTLFALTLSPSVFAASYSITVQNLTHGTYFAPLLVSAHPTGMSFFTLGNAASTNLQALAEGGNISGLAADIVTAGGMSVENPASGLLAPGATTTAELGDPGTSNTQISIAGMLVPTNDGFVALNAMTLPTTPGTYTYMLNGYDAGTEANDEIRGGGMPGEAGLPVPGPLDALVGTGGTGVPNVTAEGFVHIHRGTIGDMNSTGGTSDLNASTQRWLNPVARVVITVE